MSELISLKDLTLQRAGKEILNIPELTVNEGEVLAVVGPNGAGKTTLLHVLALLEKPTSGMVRLFRQEVHDGDEMGLRRRMAVVLQDSQLLDVTVQKNITLPLRMRGVSAAEAKARADCWLQHFGIGHLAKRPARCLSGGEAQRTSLARAFAFEPEVLFLDEPFSALDYRTRKDLPPRLGPLLRELHLTAVLVTHDYTEIPHLCQNVTVLHEGKILRHGSVAAVLGEKFLEQRVREPWEDGV